MFSAILRMDCDMMHGKIQWWVGKELDRGVLLDKTAMGHDCLATFPSLEGSKVISCREKFGDVLPFGSCHYQAGT